MAHDFNQVFRTILTLRLLIDSISFAWHRTAAPGMLIDIAKTTDNTITKVSAQNIVCLKNCMISCQSNSIYAHWKFIIVTLKLRFHHSFRKKNGPMMAYSKIHTKLSLYMEALLSRHWRTIPSFLEIYYDGLSSVFNWTL